MDEIRYTGQAPREIEIKMVWNAGSTMGASRCRALHRSCC
jgi:hypothetical protein